MKYCFYCNAIVTKDKGVGDHFPIPKRNGGKNTVPVCECCHNIKDRYALNEWPTEWIEAMIADFSLYSRETKLFLARAMSLMTDAIKK